MPWCDPCEKNWTPTSVGVDGTCPDCSQPLDGTPGVDHTPHKVPWHFWLGVSFAAVYLAWRAVQGIMLLF